MTNQTKDKLTTIATNYVIPVAVPAGIIAMFVYLPLTYTLVILLAVTWAMNRWSERDLTRKLHAEMELQVKDREEALTRGWDKAVEQCVKDPDYAVRSYLLAQERRQPQKRAEN